VPDFTSALYLGLRHATRMLRPWAALTTGTPAAIRPVPGAAAAAQRLAQLQGCEAATLLPSTLHAAWDIGGLLDRRRNTIYYDAEVYPILGATVSRAASRGVAVRSFPHNDPAALERALRRDQRLDQRRPVVLVDGLCPACGGPAPLPAYLRAARRHGGLLVVDDTQAVGILGSRRGSVPQWGRGGGGSLRFHGLLGAPDVLVVTSLAKALGVPVAAVSGSREAIANYDARSDTRVHCSPVSIADIHALDCALAINSRTGDELRIRAAAAIQRLRSALRGLGIQAAGGDFPVQALPPLPRAHAARLHRRLRLVDIHAVAQPWAGGTEGRIVFLLGARTTTGDIGAVATALSQAPELALLRRCAHDRKVAG
jgi:8-amino-7-oxononanoate synthase